MSTVKKKRRRVRYNLGDPCHDCGKPLDKVAGMSRAYVQCDSGHTASRRQLCHIDTCRRIAQQTGWDQYTGTWAACNEHVYRVSGGTWY